MPSCPVRSAAAGLGTCATRDTKLAQQLMQNTQAGMFIRVWGVARRRDCHLAGTPFPSSLKHLTKKEGGAAERQARRRPARGRPVESQGVQAGEHGVAQVDGQRGRVERAAPHSKVREPCERGLVQWSMQLQLPPSAVYTTTAAVYTTTAATVCCKHHDGQAGVDTVPREGSASCPFDIRSAVNQTNGSAPHLLNIPRK